MLGFIIFFFLVDVVMSSYRGNTFNTQLISSVSCIVFFNIVMQPDRREHSELLSCVECANALRSYLFCLRLCCLVPDAIDMYFICCNLCKKNYYPSLFILLIWCCLAFHLMNSVLHFSVICVFLRALTVKKMYQLKIKMIRLICWGFFF